VPGLSAALLQCVGGNGRFRGLLEADHEASRDQRLEMPKPTCSGNSERRPEQEEPEAAHPRPVLTRRINGKTQAMRREYHTAQRERDAGNYKHGRRISPPGEFPRLFPERTVRWRGNGIDYLEGQARSMAATAAAKRTPWSSAAEANAQRPAARSRAWRATPTAMLTAEIAAPR